VSAFDPRRHQTVSLAGGDVMGYEQLVVAPGIQLDWAKIDGLEAAPRQGRRVLSNYRYDLVDSTWRALRTLRGATPSSPSRRRR
jgi:sulfide:quinone oxidoreductase